MFIFVYKYIYVMYIYVCCVHICILYLYMLAKAGKMAENFEGILKTKIIDLFQIFFFKSYGQRRPLQLVGHILLKSS